MTTIESVERPSIRFFHKDDGGCSWRSIGNTLCGSCGCVCESDNEISPQPSESSEEWQSRRITLSATTVKRGVPVAISSMTLMSGERAENDETDENGYCWQNCLNVFRRKKPENSSARTTNSSLNAVKKRVVKINALQDIKYLSNITTTAKYNFFSFMPIFLYEQFRRYSNLFFLFTAILQQIPGVSPTGRYVTIFPLLFILIVSAIKEIAEDLKRHRADSEDNNREVDVLMRDNWKTVSWAEISVGDIVRINNKQYFPADLLYLASSKPDGMCFVQTVNLDGEANLKVKQAVPETADLDDTKKLTKLKGHIECEPPNRRIYDFIGVLHLKNFVKPISLGPNQLLQRGAALSNTKWIHGVVLYTGHDTKLMKNFARAPLKSSSVDVLMNKQILTLFVLYLVIALTSASMHSAWNYENVAKHSYLAIENAVDFKDIVFSILTFLILYNNLIPISLQVTLEMVRYYQAGFINADMEMYHEETDTPAQARTSNLNEELGMVKYVLTDKTGTLTCNIMKFKKCSIAGIMYDILESTNFESELLRNIYERHPTAAVIEEFMLAITLCHSVITEVKEDGSIVYHATNPDDQAIIEGAQRNGYEFLNRTNEYLEIKRLGKPERYQLLQVIEFSSSRKRMSVLVRMPSGNIKLYCKGADSVIFERLAYENERDYYSVTHDHLNTLAALGFRTLCCAVTDITDDQYSKWIVQYRAASASLVDREENIERVADEIEQNFTLLGVTAIEDKLQDGVPETITSLLRADIRVWMLTGDKQETAINIGFSSGLLHHKFQLFVINEESLRGTFAALRSQIMRPRDLRNVALVIDGKTLQFAMSSKLRDYFKEICLNCRVVVCCRLSPIQKGDITELVNSTGACTLAIGDGANDVAMIRKARVGVGISGPEGLQAACASDYSIAQFRYLKRLLFVHGTWNYRRITTTILYAFYKNICMCIIQLWYCIYNGWSAQILFDSWAMAGYNIFFSAMPPIALGVFDKVCNAETLLRYPRVYRRAHDAKLFNVGIFWVWIVNALIHSMVLLFMVCWIFSEVDTIWPNGLNSDHMVIGHTVYTAAIITVCLKAGLAIHSWNWITHFTIWGSIFSWYLFVIIYSYFWPIIAMGPRFVHLHEMLFSSLVFWILVILLSAMALLPDFFFKVFYNTYFTTITEVARHGDKLYGQIPNSRLTRISRKIKRATLMGYL